MLPFNKIGQIINQIDNMELSNMEYRLFTHLLLRVNTFGHVDDGNAQLSKYLGVTERTVSSVVANLEDKGLIKVKIKPREHARNIYITVGTEKYAQEPKYSELSPLQRKFKDAFPQKLIDCDVPKDVDMDLLILKIKQSGFLEHGAPNMTLKSYCITHYERIMADKFNETDREIDFRKSRKTFRSSRDYTEEQANKVLQNIEDIEV